MRNYAIVFLLSLLAFQALSGCDSGQVVGQNGICEIPNYIQGCFKYSSSKCCEQYYVKDGDKCAYSPNQNQKCCVKFDSKGDCCQCQAGLVLVNGICKEWKIIGCILKSNLECLKCSIDHYLQNGTCIRAVPDCLNYNVDGSCNACNASCHLIGGKCAKKNQTGCLPPFKTNSSGFCIIQGCSKIFELGCQSCSDGYALLPDFSCKNGCMDGCNRYNINGNCTKCIQSSHWLSNGFCLPFGCKVLQKPGVCGSCFTQTGFVLNLGVCSFPNCLLFNQNGCLVCKSNYVLTQNGCQPFLPKQQCMACKTGYRATNDWLCIPNVPGCLKYQENNCCQCQTDLYLDKNNQCQTKQIGCIYSNGCCSDCVSPFTFNLIQNTCSIQGCKTYCQTGCKTCSNGYVLTAQNTCNLPNCYQMKDSNCIKCNFGYLLKSDGCCMKTDQNCQTYDATYVCIKCLTGYYLGNDSSCTVQKVGCNYIDGRCTSCLSPFTYNLQNECCEIDGCLSYFVGGCQKCDTGYSISYNSCKLPNCLTSLKGVCKECDPDYIMKPDGTCVNKDEFCYKYDANGTCTQCAPKYYMSSKNKCTLRQPGCQYNSTDDCCKCDQPFYFDGTRCQIHGCLTLEDDGCQVCQYPYVNNSVKTCDIEFCNTMVAEKCTICKSGYALKNDGSCGLQDAACQNYDTKGKCSQCIQGYRIDVNGRCQYTDQHCCNFTKQGNCINCDRLYYLSHLNKCQLKDNNCKAYANGYCQQCKDLYYTYEGICYPNAGGCLIQKNIKQCSKCSPGYTLKGGMCTQTITKLTYNSIDMGDDFFSGDSDNAKQQAQTIFSIGIGNKVNLLGAIKQGGTVFYSSCASQTPKFQVDSDGDGWSVSGSSLSHNFVGVKLNELEIFYAVDIKILDNCTLTSFTIEYSQDGTTYKEAGNFTVTSKVVNAVSTYYFTAVQAISIRIAVNTGQPNIKFQFYYSGNLTTVQKTDNTYITQTIQTTVNNSLEMKVFSANDSCIDVELCYMGLELCEAKNITGFDLTPASNNQGTITSVTVDYSVDGTNFNCYNSCNPIQLKNNSVILNPPALGCKLRVHLSKWDGTPNYGIKFDYQI